MHNKQLGTTRIGIGIMIFKNNTILLGERLNALGAGEFGFPGGHLEYLEGFEACALREIKEECGITVTNIRFQLVANLIKYAPKHYAHIGLTADWQSGKPVVLEPQKCISWDWYSLDNLPKPLFQTCEMAIESYFTGQNYFDITYSNENQGVKDSVL